MTDAIRNSIVPFHSIGGVEPGSSTYAEVVALLGQPEGVETWPATESAPTDNTQHWVLYPSCGMRVQFLGAEPTPDSFVNQVCVEAPFPGEGPDGLRLGMARDKALAILRKHYWDHGTSASPLWYRSFSEVEGSDGDFWVHFKDDHVAEMTLYRPFRPFPVSRDWTGMATVCYWFWKKEADCPLRPEEIAWRVCAGAAVPYLAVLDRAAIAAGFTLAFPGMKHHPADTPAGPEESYWHNAPVGYSDCTMLWWPAAFCWGMELGTIGDENRALEAAYKCGCQWNQPRIVEAWESEPAFRDRLTAELAQVVRRFGDFGGLWNSLEMLGSFHLGAEHVVRLYEAIREQSGQREEKWRGQFERAFPQSAALLPPRRALGT